MIKVVDNVLTKSLFAKLENTIMSTNFPWHYGRASANNYEENLFLYSWFHTLLSENGQQSILYNELETFIVSMLDNANEDFSRIFRIRIICNTVTDKPYTTGPHVDLPIEHKTALFYVNNSDGCSNIYNELYDVGSGVDRTSYRINNLENKFTLNGMVAPIQNRLACFNGLLYHSGTTPVSSARRVLININYI